jgi:hypothetical protein
MKRLVQALLVACWLAAVAIYWHDCVPAVPTTVIEFDRPAVIIGTTRRKELVTAAPSEGDRGNPRGPSSSGTLPKVPSHVSSILRKA